MISLKEARARRQRPQQVEMALLIIIENMLKFGFEVLDVLSSLRRKKFINRAIYKNLVEKYSTGVKETIHERAKHFLEDIKRLTTFEDFVCILRAIKGSDFPVDIFFNHTAYSMFAQGQMHVAKNCTCLNILIR